MDPARGRGRGGPCSAGVRAVGQPDRPEGQGRGKGREPGRLGEFQRAQRPRGHGPGPGRLGSGAAGADDRRPVEDLQDAGALHRAAGGRTGGRWPGTTRGEGVDGRPLGKSQPAHARVNIAVDIYIAG